MLKEDLEKLTHAFISRRLDYCIGLFKGLPKKPLGRSNSLIQLPEHMKNA